MVAHHSDKIPGFMVVKRKPHPLGNEYHTICDGETAILFKMELVEGKSRPPERPLKYESHHSKTTALVMRMTEDLRGSGRVVIMDSAFCVMSAVYQLYELGQQAVLLHPVSNTGERHASLQPFHCQEKGYSSSFLPRVQA